VAALKPEPPHVNSLYVDVDVIAIGWIFTLHRDIFKECPSREKLVGALLFIGYCSVRVPTLFTGREGLV
jgi:hypothetical protein